MSYKCHFYTDALLLKKKKMGHITLPVRYVCSCSSVMLNNSAFCCWQLFLAWCHFRAASEFIWYWTFVKGSVFHNKSTLLTVGRKRNTVSDHKDGARKNIEWIAWQKYTKPKHCYRQLVWKEPWGSLIYY